MRIRQQRKNTIPEFKSKEEEAKFWDTRGYWSVWENEAAVLPQKQVESF